MSTNGDLGGERRDLHTPPRPVSVVPHSPDEQFNQQEEEPNEDYLSDQPVFTSIAKAKKSLFKTNSDISCVHLLVSETSVSMVVQLQTLTREMNELLSRIDAGERMARRQHLPQQAPSGNPRTHQQQRLYGQQRPYPNTYAGRPVVDAEHPGRSHAGMVNFEGRWGGPSARGNMELHSHTDGQNVSVSHRGQRPSVRHPPPWGQHENALGQHENQGGRIFTEEGNSGVLPRNIGRE